MFSRKKREQSAQTNITRFSPATGALREASALLDFIAGEFAGEIARLWPAPHQPFLLADAPRRHLVCVGISQGGGRDGVLRRALEGPFKRALRALAPDAPDGLTRALGRLGERAWTRSDYRLLFERLDDERTAKSLRHAEAISPRDVRVLSALPEPVRESGGVRIILTEDQGALLAECYEGLVRREGDIRARQIAGRWAFATSAEALFKRAAEDLAPDACPSPHPGTARLVPLNTSKALADAGRRYRNCLQGRILDGWSHYYEWLGSPGAVVCVSHDYLVGWRLDEALCADNRPVPDDVRREIAAELAEMGVYLGRSAWQLRGLLDQAARKGFTLPRRADEVNWLFGQ